MNNKSALTNIYKDTILGVIIGWGGFTKLFPNLLESLGSIADLGSYIALRLFSIFFFLFILIVVTTYWWARGLEIYFKNISGHPLRSLTYKKTWSAIFFLLKNVPIALFVGNQFFVYNFTDTVEWILWYYLVLAISQLLLASALIDKVNGIKLLKANTLMFSLDIVLGIGLVCFVEPWAFYKNDFIWQSVLVGILYALAAFVIYLRIRNKNNSNILQFRQLGSALFVIVFLVSVFPSVNYQLKPGFLGLVFIFILLLFTILYSVLKGRRSIRNYTSLLIGIFTYLLAGIIFLSLYAVILGKLNKKYLENRVLASKNISKSKIFPLIVYNDSLVDIKGIYPLYKKSIDRSNLALCIAENNHKWAYQRKLTKNGIKDYFFDGCDSIAIVDWYNLSEDYNVRKIYFNKYEMLSEDDLKKTAENQQTINEFYNGVYLYIHNDIIHKYIRPLLKENKIIPGSLRDYLHPINYYTETLSYYRKQLADATKIRALNKEIIGFELLQKHTQLNASGIANRKADKINKIDKLLGQINELRGTSYQKLFNLNLHQSAPNHEEDYEFSSAKNLDSFFELIELYKRKQHHDRYKKAQVIFHVYLKDSQRVGIFILVYTLLIAAMLYWFYSTDQVINADAGTTDSANEPLDSPTRFINVLMLTVTVILLYIARPIKPENIDPENPQWMMSLENWYNKMDFDVTFKDHENSASHADLKEKPSERGEENIEMINFFSH